MGDYKRVIKQLAAKAQVTSKVPAKGLLERLKGYSKRIVKVVK